MKKLTADLKKALDEARKSIEGISHFRTEYETSNSDKPILVVSPDSRIETAIKEAGCNCWYSIWHYGYVIDVTVGGNGATRTLAAEAVCRSLRESGYETHMKYLRGC